MTELTAHITKSFNLPKFLASNPSLVGQTLGFRFYEHPTRGDEAPLIVTHGEECGLSNYWEVPSTEEMGFRF